MKKIIHGKTYDLAFSVTVCSTEDRDCCTFPKGLRFDYVSLCKTECGDYFLHGKGFLGCNSMVPLTEVQAFEWLKLYSGLGSYL